MDPYVKCNSRQTINWKPLHRKLVEAVDVWGYNVLLYCLLLLSASCPACELVFHLDGS